MSELWRRLLYLFHRDRFDRELEEEMRFHLAMKTEQNEGRGLPSEDARQAAKRQFGNATLLRETSREVWGWASLERLGQDLRYALRMMTRSPGLTAAAVASLALGIGADAALFSVMDALWFRPLAIHDPGGLVHVFSSTAEYRRGQVSYADYRDFADASETFESLAASQRRGPFLGVDGVTESAFSEVVSDNYFTVLGVEAALGRVFHEQPQPESVLVISYNLWQRRFGSDPNVVGRTVELSGRPFTVVGVAPREFRGIELSTDIDLWAPLRAWSPEEQVWRKMRQCSVIGRLRSGVTLEQARAELSSIAHSLALAYPETNRDRSTTVLSVFEYQRELSDTSALLLASIVVMLLLIACANVANLLLARGEARRREIAVRLALGCGRRRLIRQLMTESALLACFGAVATVLLAAGLIRILPAILPLGDCQFLLDHRVLAFTGVAAVLTGLFFGLTPALRASRPELAPVLRREAVRGRLRTFSLRDGLVVAQMALSMVLLASAGLLIRSFLNSQSLDLGFERKNVAIVRIDPGLPEPQARVFFEQILDRVRELSGVKQAGLVRRAPLWQSEGGVTIEVTVPGHPPPDSRTPFEFKYTTAGDNYFRTMGIPLLRGRDFDDRDNATGPPAVIINETMAKRFWPAEDPIGKLIMTSKGDQRQVVGVVRDTKIIHVLEDPQPYLYLPFGQDFSYSMALVVEAYGDPAALLNPIKSEISELIKAPVPDIATLESLIRGSTSSQEAGAIVASSFGLLGILLAGAGLFGVMSFIVARRTHEIGIRMALGASKRDMLALVLQRALALAVIGEIIGLAGGLALSRKISSLLFGVGPCDPLTLSSAAAILLVVAVLASVLPAVRASNTKPAEALRHE